MNNIDPKYIFPLAFGISLEDIHTKISKILIIIMIEIDMY